ncbi:MAG: 2Fe-2S iron-sulfur cluster-binding protein [Acidimicrobiia bacterium]
MAGAHLLQQNPAPSSGEVREALSGNLCRCTGYGGIERAMQSLIEEEGR